MKADEAKMRRRTRRSLVAAAFLALLGWGVREAEFASVGSDNSASLWIWVLSGMCVYFAVVNVWMWKRGRGGKIAGEEDGE